MLSFLLFFATWSYLIVALQVMSGFPPLYVHWGGAHQRPGYKKDTLNLFLPKGYLLFASLGLVVLAAAVEIPILAAVAAIAPAYLGFTVREFLKKECDLPYPLIDFVRLRLPPFGQVTDRWPMLVFDVWTVALSLVIPATILFQAHLH